MSKSNHHGKQRKLVSSKESDNIGWAMLKRHIYGHTEKILRRNRKIWTRLVNKRRRRLDREEIESGICTHEH